MRVITLFENTSLRDDLESGHGLSLYIEAHGIKLLFDTGCNDAFISNAEKLGVNLADVDLAVISHGHYDHGGGINAFLERNSKAPVYISRHAFGEFYSNAPSHPGKYIGIDLSLKENPRIKLVDKELRISDSYTLFSGVVPKKLPIKGNELLQKTDSDGNWVNDDFAHEINLVVEEAGEHILVCGCAHNGIINIIEHCSQLFSTTPVTVIGGFHLSREQVGGQFLHDYSLALKQSGVRTFYTGHCTGEQQFDYLGSIVGGLYYMRTGSIIDI